MRRLFLIGLYAYTGWLMVELLTEIRGVPVTEPDAHAVQVLDRDGHVIAEYHRAKR